MKRRLTILTAVLALLAFLAIPMGMWGQTRESYNVTYGYSDLGDMLYGSYLDASAYWKVPETSGNTALISIPITYQPESDITVTFRIATFGSGTNPSASNTTITAIGTESNSNWSGSGVSAYPSSSTYVNGVMTITMPQNPTTLGGLDITMGVNTGVKIFRLQSITVSYTYGGGTQPETYTVTYDCNGGTSGCPENVTGIEAGEEITLANAPTKTDYDFAGWSDGSTTYNAGASYTVNGNVTMTAQWTEQSSGDDHWVLTDLADLTSTDVFVIVGNGYAMTNNNGTASAPATSAVTITGNEITSTVAANIKWTVSSDATNGYTFYPNGSTNTWLYFASTSGSGNNNNMRVGTGNRKVFVLNSSNYLVTNDNYVARYLSIYNNADWRGYINTDNAVAIYFYKKVTGDVLPPSITANNVSIAYDATSGEIAYTLNNPATNGSLSVSENVDWINNAVLSTTESKVTFTTTANEANTSREGIITITYTYGDNETVNKDVTITQAGAPVLYTTIPDLFDAATGTETDVLVTFDNWVVSGVSTNGKNVFVTDNNGNGFVIYYTTDMSSTFAAGNILSGTAVPCTLKKYNGFAELLNVTATDLTITSGGTVTVADVALADLAGVNTGALLHYDNLTCVLTTNSAGTTTYYNLTDGTTTIQVYGGIYAFGTLVEGKIYNITGVYQQYNNTKEILPRSADDIVEVEQTEYTLTAEMTNVAEYFVFVGDDEIEFDDNNQAQVFAGATVYVSLTMEDCYALNSLTVNGSTTGVTEEEPGVYYSFVMPEGDATIGVSATQATEYTLTVVGGENVTFDMMAGYESNPVSLINGTASICEQLFVTIANLTANTGLVIQSVTLTAGGSTTTLSSEYGVYNFAMPSSNATLTFTTGIASTYTLASSIVSGMSYIIVGFEGDNAYAMGEQKTSNRAGVGITVDGTTAIGNANVHEVVITALEGDDAGKYTIEDDGYLYASSSSGNQLKTEPTLDDNGKWTIVIDEDGDATITAQGNNSRKLMRFNPNTNNNNPLFACYATTSTTGSLPKLYVKDETPVTETYTLNIPGYTEGDAGGYFLIASPVTVNPATVEGMTEGAYDLYYFDQEQELEWINYKDQNVGGFSLEPGKGYLYAKQATTEGEVFQFTLTGTPYDGEPIILTKDDNGGFPGWNLVGNPLAEIAYIADNRDFYTMNDSGTAIVSVNPENKSIQPMEGVFVVASDNNEAITFTTEEPANNNDKGLVLNLNQGQKLIDRIVVRFGEGRTLSKFQIKKNCTQVYIPMGGTDYAVVRSEEVGEKPVNFKAEENGTYTLSFSAMNTEFAYIHLIDNMTGNDVDLLAEPNYSFEAQTTDSANRFKLVFAIGQETK